MKHKSISESTLIEAKGSPVKYGDKIVGKVLSAKLNKEGNLEFEYIITDSKIKEDMMKNLTFGIKILGED